jgi:nucleoid-associated protein YgaU
MLYTVTTERTFEEVAARVYGDASLWPIIWRANYVLSDVLYTDQVLFIPDRVDK